MSGRRSATRYSARLRRHGMQGAPPEGGQRRSRPTATVSVGAGTQRAEERRAGPSRRAHPSWHESRPAGTAKAGAVAQRAELAAVDGDHEVAITAYKASIENAKKHAFVNDQALATERMGLFFLNKGNLTEASKYLKQASELYETWGSIRKADHVLRKMPRLGSSDL